MKLNYIQQEVDSSGKVILEIVVNDDLKQEHAITWYWFRYTAIPIFSRLFPWAYSVDEKFLEESDYEL